MAVLGRKPRVRTAMYTAPKPSLFATGAAAPGREAVCVAALHSPPSLLNARDAAPEKIAAACTRAEETKGGGRDLGEAMRTMFDMMTTR
jgi:hypothetical protein